MEKFTKGSWSFFFTGKGDGFIELSVKSGDTIIIEACGCCDSPFGDNKHDIPIIAAATEMYDEIKQDIKWLEQMKGKFVIGSYEFRSIWLRIEAKQKLLAKARGEQWSA